MRFFEQKQIDISGDLLVARFARIPDEQKRSELILFYFEPLRNFGSTREELQAAADKKHDIFRRFEEETLRSFQVTWVK